MPPALHTTLTGKIVIKIEKSHSGEILHEPINKVFLDYTTVEIRFFCVNSVSLNVLNLDGAS